MRLVAVLLVAAAASLSVDSARVPPTAERAIQNITIEELRTHVETLASDAMAGRAVGHSGNERAAEYITAALKRAGIGATLQAVELYQPSLGPNAQLIVERSETDTIARLTAGSSFSPLPQSSPETASGRLIFAGHGISARRYGHDDYARIDANGAIVVALDDMPESLRRRSGLRDRQKIELATVDRKIADAVSHGARGLIVIRKYMGDARTLWPETLSLRTASYRLYGRIPPLAAAVISEEAALPIRRALSERTDLRAMLKPDIGIQRLTVHNVLGSTPPPAAPELVVVGAHFDHDGIDEEGRIYNGADDNASGTAAVLAIAGAFARASAAGERPRRRRVVFALWNAEEKGALGSEAFLDAAAARGRIVANINLDMVGRGAEGLHMLGYSYSPDLAGLAKRANQTTKLKIKQEYDDDASGLVERSDNWPFLKRSIPAVFFTTGLHADYHTPDDDVERLDLVTLERIAELVSRLAWIAAESDAPGFRRRLN